MKLKLEHLAPYQEHKVKLLIDGRKCNIAYLSTKRIAFIDIQGYVDVEKMKWEYASGKVKPILRPLSDLKVSGKSELLLNEISNKAIEMSISDDDFDNFCHIQHTKKGYDYLPHWWYQYLIKNHFDIFGLIEQNLAININTL